ncbi:MAG: sugar ABC transporter permease [Spirochaetes bacterium]|nr:sugar ABC transporter permease [Spirochaetota bacterium]
MKIKKDYIISIVVILPSVILLGIFVYGFILNTVFVSLTDWGKGAGLKINPVINFVGFANYSDLFTSIIWQRFRQDMVNAVFYWLFILSGSLILGFFLAVLLDRYPRGESFFRTLFLYPFALSFIVTGTIWRWLFAPNGGFNVLPTLIKLPRIEFLWMSSRTSILNFNWQDIPLIITVFISLILFFVILRLIILKKNEIKLIIYSILFIIFFISFFIELFFAPPMINLKEMHGFNLASIGIIIAAVWQYSGYTMALYLAGLRGLPVSLYEAAKIDGASDMKFYLKIAIPNLWPITLSAIIIISHISLKIFALIFAMAGTDNAGTSHPSVLMYLTTFRANNFAFGASIAVLLLILSSLFTIPYLIYLYKQRTK